jgi:flavin-binding protein dodecin
MAKTVKVVELLAESDHSWEDAATVALERARKTLRHIRSIDVGNFVAVVAAGEIKTYQLSAKISFDLESDDADPELESLGAFNSSDNRLKAGSTECIAAKAYR